MLFDFFAALMQLSLSYLTGLFKFLVYPNNFTWFLDLTLQKSHIFPGVIEAVVV